MAVVFSVREQVATVRLNRPEAMNALDPETRQEIAAIWQKINADDTIRVIIVTGTGYRAFCAGADLKKTMPPPESFAQLRFGTSGDDGIDRIVETDKPVICAINGFALAGGLELAMACDIRIAVDSARFGLTEVKIGSIPGAGGTQRLPRLVGMTNAMLLLLTADMIDSAEALRIGLISKVVPAANLMAEAEAIAARIAGNAPLAVRAVKRLVKRGADLPLAAGIEAERLSWGLLRDTKDRIEGRIAFQEKRKPVYRGQ